MAKPGTHSDTKQKLVAFLDRRAFRPVLRAKEGDYSGKDRDKLADVQRRTKTEIERFKHYGSAQEVVTNFKRDLRSKPAQRVHRDLHQLGLPTPKDVKAEFEKLAKDLGVKA
jgi:hypothetical protein